ncbi:MAG: CoA-transferase [Candidatus Promineifilaceae bacterium]|nr:CoA-transferase [Candidatus Promineifilaceae bacterium]
MTDKQIAMDQAVALVHSGDIVGLGGMTIYRRPVAFVRQLIDRSQPPTDLTLLAFTGGLAADMLVGAGLVRRTRTCYFGLEIFGLAPMFTRAATTGELEIVEESEASIASGLRAQMAGVGFMPSRAWQGTDMFTARPDVKSIADPYTGRRLTAFPAIACDVAVIHVLRADRRGNCVLGGNPTIDLELATVAKRVIITAESVERQLTEAVDIPGLAVTAVVEAPRGAWPTSCYPLYPLDGEEILRYIAYCNDGAFTTYLASAVAPAQEAAQ